MMAWAWVAGLGLVALFVLYSATYFRRIEEAVGAPLPERSARNGATVFRLFWAAVGSDEELKCRYQRLQLVDSIAGTGLAVGLGILAALLLRKHGIAADWGWWAPAALTAGLAGADVTENLVLSRAVSLGADSRARRTATVIKFLLAAVLVGAVAGGILWTVTALPAAA